MEHKQGNRTPVSVTPEELAEMFVEAANGMDARFNDYSCCRLHVCRVNDPGYGRSHGQRDAGWGLEHLIRPLGIDTGAVNQFDMFERGPERQQARFAWLWFLSDLAAEGFFHQDGPVML
jgi:hypothetical protein